MSPRCRQELAPPRTRVKGARCSFTSSGEECPREWGPCGSLPDTFRPAYPSFCVLPEAVDAIGSRLAHSIHDELSWKAPSQGMRGLAGRCRCG